MSEDNVKRLGFYINEGFWASDKPDFSHINEQNWAVHEYMETMKQEIISVSDGDRKIVVDRDGLIQYEDGELQDPEVLQSGQYAAEPVFTRNQNYTDKLNALSLVLVSFINRDLSIKVTHTKLTHSDIVTIARSSNGDSSDVFPQRIGSSSQISKRTLSDLPRNSENDINGFVDGVRRQVVPKEELIKAVNKYFAITQDKSTIKLLSQANSASASYIDAAFSSTVTIAWQAVESYLFNQLREYTAITGNPRFNARRRDFLIKESKVSEVIELLEFAGFISKDLYDLLTKVRKVRNRIIHDEHNATIIEAVEALALLELIIKNKTGWQPYLRTALMVPTF